MPSTLHGEVHRRAIIWMDENAVLSERTRHAGTHDLQPWDFNYPNSSRPIPRTLGNPGIPSLRLEEVLKPEQELSVGDKEGNHKVSD